MTAPVLFVIDDDPHSREAVLAELHKRYGGDYRVVCESSVDASLTTLQRLRSDGAQVAVMLADLWLDDMNGVEFLSRARRLHPAARRVVIFDWGDRNAGSVLLRSGTLGEIDDWVTKPWQAGDEHFHQAISSFLYDWAQVHQPGIEIVRVVGDQWSARSHTLRDMLSRSNVQFGFYEPDSETGRQLLRGVRTTSRPVVITYDGQVLADPSNSEIAQALGIRVRPDPTAVYDVLIIGMGPAGIAAAVYAGSEGLRIAGIEREAIGGQAATSSLIRNYPGFPRGITGTELTARAFQQAGTFGAEFVYAEATRLRTDGSRFLLGLRDAGEITGRAVIIATGVSYRRLGIQSLDRLLGRGVFYGAAASEASAMTGRHVYVVGGANSAGQAALHLSRHADKVTILVRRSTLTETMSDYLVRQIEAAPNIAVEHDVELVEGHGDDQLAGLTLRRRSSGGIRRVSADALFVLIGAEPHTSWLPDTIRRDRKGFILTGPDLIGGGEPPAGRPPDRHQSLFETSLPGVFAIGDVRHGSIKRVASAVGEGSVAVRLLHDHLAAVALSSSQ